MQKNTLKYIIDAAMFIAVCATGIIGLLMGFVVPRGGRWGSGIFLGLHRHEWGDFHLFLSITLLVLIGFHIMLNWAWIVGSTKRYFGDSWKKALWIMAGGWIAVLIVGWIIL